MINPRIPCIALLAAGLTVSTAWAQSSDGKPLNLKLPPSSVLPAASSSSAAPASANAAGTDHAAAGSAEASKTPGMYYGDTSGSTDAGLAANHPDAVDSCDDATYNKAQVHGSVGMGVVAGSHMSGNYQTGTVNVSKAFGDCDHPTGGVSISISGGQAHFDHGRDHRYGR